MFCQYSLDGVGCLGDTDDTALAYDNVIYKIRHNSNVLDIICRAVLSYHINTVLTKHS